MGRTAQIDRSAILRAALEVADEHGLDAVTMQAVAKRLGVTAMALYRHVADKADLLDGMVEVLLAGIPAAEPGGWNDQLTAMAHGIRAVARAHPAAFPLLLTRPAATSAALETRESVYRALRAAGLGQDAVERTERLLSTAILGFVTSEAAGRFRNHDQATIDEDFAELLRWLRRVLPDPDPARESDVPVVRYFALIKDGGTPEAATGLVRRVATHPLPTDEAIGNDLEWHPTEYLERYYRLGTMDREHLEVTAEFAEELLARWRAAREQ